MDYLNFMNKENKTPLTTLKMKITEYQPDFLILPSPTVFLGFGSFELELKPSKKILIDISLKMKLVTEDIENPFILKEEFSTINFTKEK